MGEVEVEDKMASSYSVVSCAAASSSTLELDRDCSDREDVRGCCGNDVAVYDDDAYDDDANGDDAEAEAEAAVAAAAAAVEGCTSLMMSC